MNIDQAAATQHRLTQRILDLARHAELSGLSAVRIHIAIDNALDQHRKEHAS